MSSFSFFFCFCSRFLFRLKHVNNILGLVIEALSLGHACRSLIGAALKEDDELSESQVICLSPRFIFTIVHIIFILNNWFESS